MEQDLDLDTTPTKEKKGKLVGKPKIVYGVDNKKFVDTKANAEAIAAISKASTEKEFEIREAVFSKLRPELQEQLR